MRARSPRITAKTQAEVGKMVSEQLTGGGADMFESIQKMFKGMPSATTTPSAPSGAPWTPLVLHEQMTKASTRSLGPSPRWAAAK